MDISALDPFDEMAFVVTEFAVKVLLTVVAPVKVVVPVTAKVVLKEADVPVKAPVTSTPSAKVISVESSELKVVPFSLIAPTNIFPVPFALILISSLLLVPSM